MSQRDLMSSVWTVRSLSGFGGSTTAGGINSPQTMYVTEPEIDEKASPGI